MTNEEHRVAPYPHVGAYVEATLAGLAATRRGVVVAHRADGTFIIRTASGGWCRCEQGFVRVVPDHLLWGAAYAHLLRVRGRLTPAPMSPGGS